ncbi:MAG: hypothetical protein FWF90_13890 [Promicromonosporaceae bacterium]|nr:hypothetical protein [Promicromonosporaceae bacterium]
MLEIPEAATLARQARDTLVGREIVSAVAGSSPHGFAFYTGDPSTYGPRLTGQRITGATSSAGYLELATDDWNLAFFDGARVRLVDAGAARPAKHQLLCELDDGRALVTTVQMYAGILLLPDPEWDDDPYYDAARTAPSPLTGAFTVAHLRALAAEARPALSAKALLATEQRIPGLGNGCLQDVLFTAGVHPRRKVRTLDDADLVRLHRAVVDVLTAMTDGGGRDTERDLFDRPGGYATLLSAKTLERPCPVCGSGIVRTAYLGGNVYFCPVCQPE